MAFNLEIYKMGVVQFLYGWSMEEKNSLYVYMQQERFELFKIGDPPGTRLFWGIQSSASIQRQVYFFFQKPHVNFHEV